MSELSIERDDILRRVDLGFSVEDFLSGKVGRYLEERAIAQIEAAKDMLCTADPRNAEAIQGLQNDVRVAQQWRAWLEDAIQDGKQAQEEGHALDGN